MSQAILDLHRRLRLHVPHDAEEARHLERMLELSQRDASAHGQAGSPSPQARKSDLLSRASFLPGHFTASAFVLSPDRSALLLIFHGKLQRWLQPGGHVEAEDADILAAARREAQEEVGLSDLALAHEGIFDVDIHEIPAFKEPAHAHFDVRFAFCARDLAFVAASDAKAARWVPLREISAETSDRSVMRAVDKLLAR